MEIDHYFTQRDPFPSSSLLSSISSPSTSTKIPPLAELSTLLLYDDLDIDCEESDDLEPSESPHSIQTQEETTHALAQAEAFLNTIEVTRPRARKIAGSKRVAGAVRRGLNVNVNPLTGLSVLSGSGDTQFPTLTTNQNQRLEIFQSITALRLDSSFEELRVECYLQARVGYGFRFDDDEGDGGGGGGVGKGEFKGYKPPYAVPPFDERTGMPQKAWALPPVFRPVGIWVGAALSEGSGIEDIVMESEGDRVIVCI